jgi:hypothetical protein
MRDAMPVHHTLLSGLPMEMRAKERVHCPSVCQVCK